MARFVFFLTVLILFTTSLAEARSYGKGISLSQTTPVSAILAEPDQFIGKPVRIEGMIIEVCAKRGCWIYVAGDTPGEKIQVKVVDGEIVFPMSATGRHGIIEGIVEELHLSEEEKIAYLKHMAEEKAKPFDPAAISDDSRFIRLRGIGAEITE